jgi:hypothetical protein
VPGNTPGTGRPPSELRARLRGSFEKRIQVLEAFADGDVDCSPSDRLRAIELLARYGLGPPPQGIELMATDEASSGGVVFLPAPGPPLFPPSGEGHSEQSKPSARVAAQGSSARIAELLAEYRIARVSGPNSSRNEV